MPVDPPKVHCKGFEDNSAALEMVCLCKIHPRTKHINLSFHFFREAVKCKEVTKETTPTENQIADMLTKPLPKESFT